MEDQMLDYFTTEKQESLLFMAVGIATLVISFYLYKTDSTYKGMIYPFILIAIIQIVVGSSVYFRTDRQVASLEMLLKNEPATYKTDESQRMTTVIKNFRIYKSIEITLLVIGILLTFLFRENILWYSVGVGLFIQSSLMLALDLFAEKRAYDYLKFVIGS